MELIINYLKNKGSASVKELSEELGLSRQYLHKILNKLIEAEKIVKLGSSPFVYYQLNEAQTSKIEENSLTESENIFLQNNFLVITELGVKLTGAKAMFHWCTKQKLPHQKTVNEFISTRKKYLNFYNADGLINGTQKIKSTVGLNEINIDELFYLDFYAIERFGKTKLGTLMHFAKQGQNKILMAQIVAEIKERIELLIKTEKIEAVLFVPPTIKREVQMMKYLETHLKLKLPHIKIKKVHNQIVMPQKALSKINERVQNAKMSFVLIENEKFKNVLLIDDAVGSGATINEIAGKLKHRKTAHKTIGLAITGSYKGFEVITEL